jgi:predicted  nucleic acid-binding Zn-ribbon protein
MGEVMNLAKRLYELQSIDLDIQSFRETLAQLDLQIGADEVVLKAKADLDALKKHLAETSQKCRDMEWETDDLRKSISKLNEKLYGGKVGNPKELLSLEQELQSFSVKLRGKEDDLLELMNEEEITRKSIAVQSERVVGLEEDWQQQQKVLMKKKQEVEKQLLDLDKKRQEAASSIDSQALSLYEGLRLKRGQAVVRVEQGMCQGCRITLPMNEWQRAKSGTVVQCSSCGKILYLE